MFGLSGVVGIQEVLTPWIIGEHGTPVIVKSTAAEVGKTGPLNVIVGTVSVGLLLVPLSGLNWIRFGKGPAGELPVVKLQLKGLASVSPVKLTAEFKLAW